MASAAWGEQQAAAPAPAPSPAAEVQGHEYRIGPEDVLQIAVWQNAELSRTLPVRPDGKISLPLVNDIQAAGLTPMELRDALKAASTSRSSARCSGPIDTS
jgi:polysaccharide export outer membrane protein